MNPNDWSNTPGCADALMAQGDENVEIGTSDFNDGDSEPEEFGAEEYEPEES